MATIEEQEKLLQTLKFTPRTYKISMWGYGGERVMGTANQEVWDYCMDNQVDLGDIAWDSDAAEEMGLNEDKLPFPPGAWYECDNMAHVSGVSRDSGTLQIEDENGETVIEKQLEDCDGGDDSPELECLDEASITSCGEGEIVFVGSSNEKGTFFEGEIELTAPFDITKLTLQFDEVDGEEIIHSVTYDGVDIDNYGGSTDGKSSDFTMVRLTDNKGNWERYEPGEKDWGEPAFGPSPSDWEKSPEFKFKKHKPVHVGWYSCVWSNWGTSYGSAYWNGKEFGEWEYGKFKPITSVQTWQGYNWDTSSWANQPPAPPEVCCKKCNWVGSREDMAESNYEYLCPNCEAKEDDLNWLSYDPDTKEGLANRKKYIEEWDPVAALEAIIATPTREELEQALEDFNKDRDPNAKWPL